MEYKGVKRACCVCGQCMYKEIWEATVGEMLVCKREPRNAVNKYMYAVAVKKAGSIIRHYMFAYVSYGEEESFSVL